MSSIHYKFRATLEYKTLQFEGLQISVNDCKREICAKENIKAEAFDLLLQNAHTKRNYSGEELIPRNSSIIVQRIPRENAEKLPKIQGGNSGLVTRNAASSINDGGTIGHVEASEFDKLSEAERLEHIKDVSTVKYQPSNFQKRTTSIMSGPPPPTYTCNRCYQPGHWYKNCPMLNTKRTTGLTGDELMETTADDPMAMLTPTGKYVVPIMHWKARNQKKAAEDAPVVQRTLPPELACPLCHNLIRDAVLTICCGDSFCAECVSAKVMESDTRKCPGSGCNREGGDREFLVHWFPSPGESLGVDQLVPNLKVRQAAESWLAGSGGTPTQMQQLEPPGITQPPTVQPQVTVPRIRIGFQQQQPQPTTAAPVIAQRAIQPEVPGMSPSLEAVASPSQPVVDTLPPTVVAPSVAQSTPPATSTDLPSTSVPPPTVLPAGTAPIPGQPVPAFQPNIPPPNMSVVPPTVIVPTSAAPIYQQLVGQPGYHAYAGMMPPQQLWGQQQYHIREAWEEYIHRKREERERSPKKRRRKRSRSRSSSSTSSGDYRKRERRQPAYRGGSSRGGRGREPYYAHRESRPHYSSHPMGGNPREFRGPTRSDMGPSHGRFVPQPHFTPMNPMEMRPISLLENDIEPPPEYMMEDRKRRERYEREHRERDRRDRDRDRDGHSHRDRERDGHREDRRRYHRDEDRSGEKRHRRTDEKDREHRDRERGREDRERDDREEMERDDREDRGGDRDSEEKRREEEMEALVQEMQQYEEEQGGEPEEVTTEEVEEPKKEEKDPRWKEGVFRSPEVSGAENEESDGGPVTKGRESEDTLEEKENDGEKDEKGDEHKRKKEKKHKKDKKKHKHKKDRKKEKDDDERRNSDEDSEGKKKHKKNKKEKKEKKEKDRDRKRDKEERGDEDDHRKKKEKEDRRERKESERSTHTDKSTEEEDRRKSGAKVEEKKKEEKKEEFLPRKVREEERKHERRQRAKAEVSEVFQPPQLLGAKRITVTLSSDKRP